LKRKPVSIVILIGLIAGALLLTAGYVSAAEGDVHQKAQQQEVVAELFVTSWCPYCIQAKNYLEKRGVKFVVYDIEEDFEAAKRKRELDPGRGVPFAIIKGEKISGWSKKMYDIALDL
jgi:glutaredoxin